MSKLLTFIDDGLVIHPISYRPMRRFHFDIDVEYMKEIQYIGGYEDATEEIKMVMVEEFKQFLDNNYKVREGYDKNENME